MATSHGPGGGGGRKGDMGKRDSRAARERVGEGQGESQGKSKIWAWIPLGCGGPRTKVEMVEGALVWGGLLGAMVSERPEGGGGIVGLGLGQWTGAEHVDFGNSSWDWKPYAWVDPSRPRAWSLRRRTPGPWALGFGGPCREGRGAGVVPPKGRPWEPLGPQDCGRTRSGRAGMDTTQPVTPLRQVYCRTRHPFLIGPDHWPFPWVGMLSLVTGGAPRRQAPPGHLRHAWWP